MTEKEYYLWRVVKGIFVTRDWPFLFPVKCEIAIILFPHEL